MSERTRTRRSVLRGIGAAAATTVVGTGVASAGEAWTVVESPVDVALYDVVATTTGPYAAGGAGTVVERTEHGWRTVFGGGGAVFDRTSNGWDGEQSPTGANLTAVLSGAPSVAVGAGGTVVER